MAAILYEGVVSINEEFAGAIADQVLRENRNQYSRTTLINGLPRKNSEAKLSNPKAITSKSRKKSSAPIFCDIASIRGPDGHAAGCLSGLRSGSIGGFPEGAQIGRIGVTNAVFFEDLARGFDQILAVKNHGLVR